MCHLGVCTLLGDDIDVAYGEIANILQHAIDVNCHLKHARSSEGPERVRAGWLSPEIVSYGKELKNLFWLAKELGDESVWELYKSRKRGYNRLILDSKRRYNGHKIEMSDNRQRTLWNLVNVKTGRTRQQGGEVTLRKNGSEVNDPKEVACIFVDYFSSIAEKCLFDKFGDNVSTQCTLPNLGCGNTFFFRNVDGSEVLAAINRLKNKKSVGLDEIPVRVIKCIGEYIVQPICHLVNLAFSTGRFPSELKRGLVIPVYKGLDRKSEVNYRPITILSVLSKIIERIFYDRMMQFLNKFDIVTECQHGFRTGRSTEGAATALMECVYKRLDQGEYVAGLFFDLSKAFDSLNIDFLLCKLYSCGFRGSMLAFLESFLRDRRMCVRVGGALSEERHVDVGVPQGSVLGPLLFVIFVNEMPEYVKRGNVVMFADDTSVVVSAGTPAELKTSVNEAIRQFKYWCSSNNLILNLDKSVYIHFKSSTARDSVPVENIRRYEGTKFLGLMLDEIIRWCDHVDHVTKKLNSVYYVISQLRNEFETSTLLTVYYSMAYCHLNYCIVLWGNSVDSDRVFLAQKRMIRLIFRVDSRASCRPVFVANEILSLPCLYIYKLLLFVKQNCDINESGNFTKNSDLHSYKTRYCDLFVMDGHNLTKFESSPVYAGKRLYNRLPVTIRKLDFNRFKYTIKELLLRKCYYSVGEYMCDDKLI